MDESQILLTFAEVALALSGFSGIVLILARQPGRWAEAETTRLIILLSSSVSAMLLALVAVGLHLVGLQVKHVAATGSGLAAAVIVISALFVLPRSLRLHREAPELQSRFIFSFGLLGHAVNLLFQILNCIGVFFDPNMGVFFFGLVWFFVLGVLQFVRILLVRPVPD